MSDSGEEYEVESVSKARCHKPGRGKKRMEFYVKWKGYPESGSTWEPIASFKGSEHFVESFWKSANHGGRDYTNINDFQLNEEFVRVGPPRKGKKSSKSASEASQSTSKLPRSREKRNAGSKVEESPASGSKRSAPESLRSRKKPRRGREKSVEVISSDTEPEHVHSQRPTEENVATDVFTQSTTLEPPAADYEDDHDPPFDESTPTEQLPSLPAHRARKVNPRLKPAEQQFSSMEGAISVKARLSGHTIQSKTRSTTAANSKSSLLTFDKTSRGLKSIQGKYNKVAASQESPDDEALPDFEDEYETSDNPPLTTPPTSGELLHLAGVSGNNLDDFEEEQPAEQGTTVLQRFNSFANSLFPSSATTTAIFGQRQSIFGLLGTASGISKTSDTTSTSGNSIRFSLRMNPSVVLSLVAETPSEVMAKLLRDSASVTPGQFYSGHRAQNLLNCVRSDGVAGKVLRDSAAAGSGEHYDAFYSRLESGQMFVAMMGEALFAYCHSDNFEIRPRLNVPFALLDTKGLLVSRITIDNYSRYADAACHTEQGW